MKTDTPQRHLLRRIANYPIKLARWEYERDIAILALARLAADIRLTTDHQRRSMSADQIDAADDIASQAEDMATILRQL